MAATVSTNPRMASQQNQPAAAAQPTTSLAAQAGGSMPAGITANSRWVCTQITCTIAAAGTVQPPLIFNLRDGASGAGTILWSGALSAPVNQCASLAMTDLSIRGSANTAMTLEAAAATATAVQGTVAISAYVEDLTGP